MTCPSDTIQQCSNGLCVCINFGSAAPSYVSASTLSVGDTTDQFVDLAFAVPYLAGTIDADLSSKLSTAPLELSLDPKFFQLPYIYSFASNLSKGNFTASILKDDDKETVTSYKIPYKSEFSEKVVNFVTTLVKETNILFHEIPREFSYNSAEQASVATSVDSNGNYTGVYLVPKSFIDGKLGSGNIKYDLKINPKTDIVVEAKPSYTPGCLTCGFGRKKRAAVSVSTPAPKDDGCIFNGSPCVF